MRKPSWAPSTAVDEFDVLVENRAMNVAFQPIVEIASGDVVGYEGLARPPSGSAFTEPEALFAEAYRRDRVGDLDWVCRAAVFAAALEKRVPPSLPLFVNVEPAALTAPCPVDIIGLYTNATARSRFVLEVTERLLATDPAELLTAIKGARESSIGVALDDVGANPTSLALLPLVEPDVIKLDLSLIQNRPNPDIASIANAVLAEAERTGAVILAEGVESARHAAVARSMGATLGQGWYFGLPGPLPDDLPDPPHPLALSSGPMEIAETPFDAARSARSPVATTPDLLAATSRYLEHQLPQQSGQSVLLTCFSEVDRFSPRIRHRYERLAHHTALAAVLGHGMPPEPAAGVRGVGLRPDDPLRREWTVVVLGNQFSGALCARFEGDRWEAVVTYDRDAVVAAARSLLQRVPAA